MPLTCPHGRIILSNNEHCATCSYYGVPLWYDGKYHAVDHTGFKDNMTYRPQSEPTAPYAEFRAAVKQFVQSHDTARKELAREFEVSQGTVDRWWLGTATPHPLIQKRVMEWIGRFCKHSVPFGPGTQKCPCHGVATEGR